MAPENKKTKKAQSKVAVIKLKDLKTKKNPKGGLISGEQRRR